MYGRHRHVAYGQRLTTAQIVDDPVPHIPKYSLCIYQCSLCTACALLDGWYQSGHSLLTTQQHSKAFWHSRGFAVRRLTQHRKVQSNCSHQVVGSCSARLAHIVRRCVCFSTCHADCLLEGSNCMTLWELSEVSFAKLFHTIKYDAFISSTDPSPGWYQLMIAGVQRAAFTYFSMLTVEIHGLQAHLMIWQFWLVKELILHILSITKIKEIEVYFNKALFG